MIQHIPVAFCFDENYAPYAAVATFSLFKSSSSPLKIYWVTTVEDLEKAIFFQQALKKFNIYPIILTPEVSYFRDWRECRHITRAAYLRLLLPILINEKKLIYLDCDMLVQSDLSELFQVDMTGYLIGGISDSGGQSTSKIPRQQSDQYINSGVLLMDLDGLRKDGFLEKCRSIYEEFHEIIVWSDQCIINKYAENRKLLIEPKWNRLIYTHTLNEVQWKEASLLENSKIIHFAGGIKPWQEWCNPVIADFWWSFANQLGAPNLNPVKITEIQQALDLASILDLNERFQDASYLKNSIIGNLIDLVNKK